MGGIQVIMTGDFCQLSPVGDFFIFESEVWNQLNCDYFILNTFYRFNDMKWTNLLSRCRIGELNNEDKKIIKSRMITVKDINEWKDPIRPTMIFPTNSLVDKFNIDELDRLPGELTYFKSIDASTKKNINIDIKLIEKINNLIPIDQVLKLKEGCQVMLRRNMNTEAGLVNGSRGVVIKIDTSINAVLIKFENYNNNTSLINWEQYNISASQAALAYNVKEYPSDCEWIFPIVFSVEEFISPIDKTIVYNRLQFPLSLSAATSIHKSQGCTLSSVIIDIGNTIFADGQSYVALSRCKSLEGVYILNLNLNKIKANQLATSYEKHIKQYAKIID
jgi:ATP-dependent DNA helicase PIF1